jgi:membrane protease YdiL (CAAX protease family)
MQRHPLLSYFSIAYAVKCVFLVPYTLAAWGVISGDWDLAFVVATFGPLMGGVVMSYVDEGKPGLYRLRDGIRKWRVGRWWLLFIFAGIPVALMAGVLAIPGSLVGFVGLPAVVALQYPLYYFGVWFGGGGLNEELGWRGFALPRMQPRYGPLWGTLLLGAAHCFWHIEEFLTPAQGGGPGTGWTPFVVNLPIFFVLVVSFSIIATWVFNRTRGSLFAVISTHASVDTPQPVLIPFFPAVGVTSMLLGSAVGLGALAVVIVVLTRGRLGYERGGT